MSTAIIPTHMKAVRYNDIQDFSIVTIPVPEPGPHQALIKVKSCGICGTDLHIHDGDFESRMPVITGHETSGVVVKLGLGVTSGLEIGQSVTADNSELCGECYYCRKGQLLFCSNFQAHGVHLDGGFAEYCVFPVAKLFPFSNLSWEEATLFEAAACAVHGVDRIRPTPGSSILILGAGATGLLLGQLLRLNGSSNITIASNAGPKIELARSYGFADEIVALDRVKPEEQWEALQAAHPKGFDVVVEATGAVSMLPTAIDFCARGGTVVFYGAYEPNATVSIYPARIFLDEITILGSFSEMWCLPRAVQYLDTRKVNVEGIVTHTFALEDFAAALDAIRKKQCIKAAIMPEKLPSKAS